MQYPESWYPIALASKLKVGQVSAHYLMGRKIAVFRTAESYGALDARCCHIGADLSEGLVKENGLECPVHRWRFDVDGQCVHIPCSNKIPSKAKQVSFPCMEHYGIVFVYLGAKPAFELPRFASLARPMVSDVRVVKFDSAYEMAAANSFDEQHLHTVHQREVIGKQSIHSEPPYHFGVQYKAKVSGSSVYDRILKLLKINQVHMRLDCWGGNLLLFTHIGSANHMLIALTPLEAQCSQAYITTVIDSKAQFKWFDWLRVRVLNRFTMMFVQQDMDVLKGMRFSPGVMLEGIDFTMMQWYRYWRRLPRYHVYSVDTAKDKKNRESGFLESVSH